MVRLLVTDVDGTLVEEGKGNLNPAYFDTVRALKEKGIQVVVASGRPYPSIRSLFAPVEEDIWFIADGGAVVKTTHGIETVGAIPEDWARELWRDISLVPDSEGILCSPEVVYIPFEDSYMCQIAKKGYQMNLSYLQGWERFPEASLGKISLFCRDGIEEKSAKYLVPQWKDKLYMVIAGEWWMDCMMPGVNKGSALQRIMDEFGYDAEEIVAFGDNMNDLEMLQLVGRGLAVSSARDEVKAVANGVIGNYKNDGVLVEWQKYL